MATRNYVNDSAKQTLFVIVFFTAIAVVTYFFFS